MKEAKEKFVKEISNLNFIMKNCLPKTNYFENRRKTLLQIEQSLFDDMKLGTSAYNTNNTDILDPEAFEGEFYSPLKCRYIMEPKWR